MCNYVASTRRLLYRSEKVYATRSPVVIGNPDFRGYSVEKASRVRSVRYLTGSVPQLPGAEKEAQEIAHLLGTGAITGRAATESFVKSLQSPEVLHVATHGYFSQEVPHPLLSGGLLLAGASLWDSLYPPPGSDDGRLIAREASLLNLQHTRLVALSACETGLGIVTGDGLYGLWRAFLEAGAHTVVATLWAVDDEATQSFMTGFYRTWIRSKKTPQRGFLPSFADFSP